MAPEVLAYASDSQRPPGPQGGAVGTTSAALLPRKDEMLEMCADALATTIVEVDVTFTDGTVARRVRLADGAMLLPVDAGTKTVRSIAVPLEQRAQHRTQGHAASFDRDANQISIGTTLMLHMLKK
jgi:hypothetical protein